jgi:hypothetical protein
MNIEIKKVTTACFLGGSLGALVALELNQYFWWLGIIFGCLVGYIGYSFKEIPSAMKKAWEITRSNWTKMFLGIFSVHYWCNALCVLLKTFSISILYIATFAFVFVILIAFIGGFIGFFFITILSVITALDYTMSGISPIEAMNSFIVTLYIDTIPQLLWYCFMPQLSVILGLKLLVCIEEKQYFSHGVSWINCISIALAFSPLAIFFIVPLCLVVLVIAVLIIFSSVLFMVMKEWVKNLFILIHSDMRLLCATDALIGATTGYLVGNAFVGGIIGAISGIINYQLVSVRWLKLCTDKNIE